MPKFRALRSPERQAVAVVGRLVTLIVHAAELRAHQLFTLASGRATAGPPPCATREVRGKADRGRQGRPRAPDALSRLADADLRQIGELNIRTVVDFRIDEELKFEGADRLPAGREIRQLSVPINPAGSAGYVEKLLAGQVETADETAAYMKALHAALALDHAREYQSFLQAVLHSDGEPLLFHCTAGKDRAGLAAAFLLRLLGAPMRAIEANYLASPPARLPEDVDFFDGIDPALIEPMLGVDVEYLREAFAAIDLAYGSFETYAATALGIDPERRRRLMQLLTEPGGG